MKEGCKPPTSQMLKKQDNQKQKTVRTTNGFINTSAVYVYGNVVVSEQN
jgi:hypothetical protein